MMNYRNDFELGKIICIALKSCSDDKLDIYFIIERGGGQDFFSFFFFSVSPERSARPLPKKTNIYSHHRQTSKHRPIIVHLYSKPGKKMEDKLSKPRPITPVFTYVAWGDTIGNVVNLDRLQYTCTHQVAWIETIDKVVNIDRLLYPCTRSLGRK